MKTLLLFLSIFIVLIIKSQHQVGHYNVTFQDPERGNRAIETEIYYPATSAGDNTPVVAGNYPVIVFGHGFVMAWSAYENLWEEFVPRGYIMVFPRTEGSIFGTDHQAFGWDLEYLVTQIQAEGLNATSPIFNAVAANTALMGHSMGGGASFLAADSLCSNGNTNLKTLIGLAPAESSTNGVSSINSALSITVPSVVLSGAQDGVTPAVDHHIPMYDNLASDCKTFINVLGGAHCYFANTNTACDFGEGTSSSGIAITRTEQHQVTFDFLNLWLDYTLKGDCDDFSTFQDSLTASTRITYNQSCNYQPLEVAPTVIQPSCNGMNGSATLQITGGETAYTEDWGGANSSALSAGSHSYTVSDAAGCVVSGNVTIVDPSAITVTKTVISPSCSGLSDGSVSLMISGGTPGYTEGWGSLNVNAVPAGTHNFTVTDLNGCIISGSVVMTEPTPITVTSFISEPSCNGLSDGSALLTISGGTPGYNESWGSVNPNALSAGTFNYSITDDNNCVYASSVTLSEPSAISIDESITNPLCNGEASGSIVLSITGGTPGYIQDWGTVNPNMLSAGSYSVTVTDVNGCSKIENYTLVDPTDMVVSATISNPTCFGASNGGAVLNISGGNAGYTEDWGGVDPNALPAGTHSFEVIDAVGCVYAGDVTLTSPSPITYSSSLVSPSCAGGNDGSALLVISGGTPVYTQDWGVADPSALSAGTFGFTITDAANCTQVGSVTIVEPTGVNVVSNILEPSCFGGTDGSATLTISGGTAGYIEDWGGVDQNNLEAGSYSVLITDAEGCELSHVVTVGEPSALLATTQVSNPSCNGFMDGEVILNVVGGTPGYIEDWNGVDPSSIGAGNYSVGITDANGCFVSSIFSVTEPTELTISLSTQDEVNGNDGEIAVIVTGGTPAYEYSIDNGAFVSNNVFSGLSNGVHTIFVQDANGCSVSATSTVDEASSVGIGEGYFAGVSVYPVPMTNNLSIDFSNKATQDQVAVVVVNVLGEIMYSDVVDRANTIHTIDVAMYPSGAYFLTLQSSEKLRVIKLVK